MFHTINLPRGVRLIAGVQDRGRRQFEKVFIGLAG